MRYFSRGHRCIAYSARGYTPSDVPPSADVYTYKHFYYRRARGARSSEDRQAAHLVGLSMGSYSSLQVGLQRAGARAVDDAGRRRLGLEPRKPRGIPQAVPGQCRAVRERSAPPRSPRPRARRRAEFRSCSRTRAATRISMPRWRGTMPRLGQYHARLPGRPAVDLHHDRGDPEGADADLDHLRRRGRRLHRAQPVSEEAPAGLRAGHVSEDRPRAQSGGARAVQRNGRTLHRAGRSRPLAGARSAVDSRS